MLHVMRDADDISRVKTSELHPDVLIVTSLENAIFKNNNPQYLVILHGDLS